MLAEPLFQALRTAATGTVGRWLGLTRDQLEIAFKKQGHHSAMACAAERSKGSNAVKHIPQPPIRTVWQLRC